MKRSRIPLLLATFFCLSPLPGAQTVLEDYVAGGLRAINGADITPDGRYIIIRNSQAATRAHVYDAATGAELAQYNQMGLPESGYYWGGIAATNDRAVVAGGGLQIFDLNNLGAPPLVAANIGEEPRDLKITPDGAFVAVRGGSGPFGGLFVFELGTGTLVAQAPGEPDPFNNATIFWKGDNSVGVTDRYAAFVSVATGNDTRVTIMDLHPSGGGAPSVVYETGLGSDLDIGGLPSDMTITPDGEHLVVRTEAAIGVFSLSGASPQLVWMKDLSGGPAPPQFKAIYSIVVSNDRIATMSVPLVFDWSARVDIFDLAGNHHFDLIDGYPGDLAITPNGRKLLVHTNTNIYMYSLRAMLGGPNIHFMSKGALPGTSPGLTFGRSTLAVTESTAITSLQVNQSTDIRFWDITGQDLIETAQYTLPAYRMDLALTPSGTKIVIGGYAYVAIFDMITQGMLLGHQVNHSGIKPGFSGVVVNDATAACFGGILTGCLSCVPIGWLSIVDLFAQPSVYCSSNSNSSGDVGAIYATGSGSVANNNLRLVAQGIPTASFGAFLYGDGQTTTPFGAGVLCVGGQNGLFGVQQVSTEGIAELGLDAFNLPFGSPAIVAGSSRYFQFLFRDGAAGQVNTTDALEVLFTL